VALTIRKHPHIEPALEVICGPMFSGKTEEIVRQVRRAEIGRLGVRVFFPSQDSRSPLARIIARSGQTTEAIRVGAAAEILQIVRDDVDVVAIDEAQFFDEDLVAVVHDLLQSGRRVVVAGLDLDFAARPFGPMPYLLALADRVDKLAAVCVRCGSPHATRTQRLVDGRSASAGAPIVLVGDSDLYEARCLRCYEPP
jgi:thymidine kinase